MANLPSSLRDCLKHRGMKDPFEAGDVAKTLAEAVESKKVAKWIEFALSAGEAAHQALPCLASEWFKANPDEDQKCVRGDITRVGSHPGSGDCSVSVRAKRRWFPPWKAFDRQMHEFELRWHTPFLASWPPEVGDDVEICYREADGDRYPIPAAAVKHRPGTPDTASGRRPAAGPA